LCGDDGARVEKKTRTTADPYGMTNKRAGNDNGNKGEMRVDIASKTLGMASGDFDSHRVLDSVSYLSHSF